MAWGPDVLALQRPADPSIPLDDPGGGAAVATAPPKAHFHARAEIDVYADKAKAVVIRHRRNHQVIAMVEIVSPGNKTRRLGMRAIVDKPAQALRSGIHLLIVDLFPPGPRDPGGINRAVWDEVMESDFSVLPDKPLSIGAYVGRPCLETYIRLAAVGDPLPEMPLFLTPDVYVPLEATYQSAWEAMPAFWREALTQ